jgi:hypothetical protein
VHSAVPFANVFDEAPNKSLSETLINQRKTGFSIPVQTFHRQSGKAVSDQPKQRLSLLSIGCSVLLQLLGLKYIVLILVVYATYSHYPRLI